MQNYDRWRGKECLSDVQCPPALSMHSCRHLWKFWTALTLASGKGHSNNLLQCASKLSSTVPLQRSDGHNLASKLLFICWSLLSLCVFIAAICWCPGAEHFTCEIVRQKKRKQNLRTLNLWTGTTLITCVSVDDSPVKVVFNVFSGCAKNDATLLGSLS